MWGWETVSCNHLQILPEGEHNDPAEESDPGEEPHQRQHGHVLAVRELEGGGAEQDGVDDEDEGHDDDDGVGGEPGEGLAGDLLDAGEHEEDVDEDHDNTDWEERQVETGDEVSVPDASNIQGGGAQVPGNIKK